MADKVEVKDEPAREKVSEVAVVVNAVVPTPTLLETVVRGCCCERSGADIVCV